jgi:hypothetical protein
MALEQESGPVPLFCYLEPITEGILMDPRERLLGLAVIYRQRGDPIPLDVLAEADQLGLSLEEFDEPVTFNKQHEGE